MLGNREKKIGVRQKFQNKPRQPGYKYPKMIEAKYARIVETLIASLADFLELRLIPDLSGLQNYYRSHIDQIISHQRSDDFTSDLRRIFAGILLQFGKTVDDSREQIRQIGKAVDRDNQKQTASNIQKTLGINLLAAERDLDGAVNAWVSGNVDLIKKMGADELARIEGIVIDGFRAGLRPESIADGILDNFRSKSDRVTLQATGLSAQDRAKLLGRDQLGKLNGQISRQRQTKLGLGRYRWRTSLDERVRQSHQVLEGRIFYWDESLGDVAPEGPPGQPINCRCYAEPVLEDLFLTEDE